MRYSKSAAALMLLVAVVAVATPAQSMTLSNPKDVPSQVISGFGGGPEGPPCMPGVICQ